MPPSPIDLTSLVAVKSRAEMANPYVASKEDAQIQAAITGFSQWLLAFTGRASLNSIVTLNDTYNGNGNMRQMLRSYPAISLIAVTMNGTMVPLSSQFGQWGAFLEDSKFAIALRGGMGNFSSFPYPNTILGRSSFGPTFLRGLGNVQVQYTAGYPPSAIQNEVDVITAQTIQLQQGPWASDLGVSYYPSLTPLVQVGSAPTVGQYAVSNGLYVFNAADNAQQVAVSYKANLAPADLSYAVTCAVSINYKRKAWQDLESKGLSTGGGADATTRYRSWSWPPEYQRIFEDYQRKAII